MLHVRMRSLRATLLAAALTAAVAVPTAAGPAAPAVSTINAERAKAAVDHQAEYRRKAGGGRDHAEIDGRITWSDGMIQHRGDVHDRGRGYSIVSFELLGPDKPVRRFFITYKSTETDFRVRGRFDRVRVLVCKIAIPSFRCDTKVYRDQPS
jgi:hypothetical protein